MDILPGLMCNNCEIFTIGTPADGKTYAVVNGARIPFSESPAHIIEAVDNTMTAEDQECLDDWGVVGVDARREQWAACNLGAYNHSPDYSAGQPTVTREFVKCPGRSTCKYNKKFCRTQEQITGLTTRQLQYAELTARGLLDKEIAQIMGVAEETVKSHSQNIRIKTGLARKADLVRYAQKLNLNIYNND